MSQNPAGQDLPWPLAGGDSSLDHHLEVQPHGVDEILFSARIDSVSALVRAAEGGEFLGAVPECCHARMHCKTVCPLSRGGSPYTAPPRVARRGRADPHRRRTSRGAL